MLSPWITHSTRETYHNPWIRVREDQVTDPGGNPGIYGVVEFKNRAVGVVPIDDEGYTYLVGQYRYCHQSYEWEIPEGGSPEGEELIDTARRELIEETGIHADQFELILSDLQLSNSTTNEVAYLFTARGLHFKKAIPESTEQIEVKRVLLEDAIEMARNGTIRDGMSVIALLWLGSQP
ncbi:NUDIX hydrolase [Phragmitibacter flavus]|uniref:GDP-mannose pyrophosphatase n=1 Tax=Phragmitibacter flavus TaxID=2576071 RepID=A0A5R8KGY1_9BACT|nr:NUDIX hydrolase [Phragmitibacter flavus]TLD70859.1 NUDIX hydrolase [Phragmitibacter flavus]